METGNKVEVHLGGHAHKMKVLVNDQDLPRIRGIKLESHIDTLWTTLTVEVLKLPITDPYGVDIYSGVFVTVEDWNEFQAWKRSEILK